MSFPIVRSVLQVSVFALELFTGADRLLMLVFEALSSIPETPSNNRARPGHQRHHADPRADPEWSKRISWKTSARGFGSQQG
jgi:hypothetical protein